MILIFLILLSFFTKPVFAEIPIVAITNFSSNSAPEWVEIYNNSPNIIDLNHWSLGDGSTQVMYDLPLSGCLSPNSYQTFFHESGWLNDAGVGDTIFLFDSSNVLIDTYVYSTGKYDTNFRSTNTCVPTIAPTSPPLPSITPSPTPTSVPPTNTPTPTQTPTPTATKTPTPTPTFTITPTPSAILTPSIEPTPDFSNPDTNSPAGNVLAASSLFTTPTPTPNDNPSSKVLPIIFIVLGAIFLGIPLVISKIKKNEIIPQP